MTDGDCRNDGQKTTNLKVTGMTCQHCVHAVKTALEEVPGVVEANVSLESGSAAVRHDCKGEIYGSLKEAVINAGYGVEGSPGL